MKYYVEWKSKQTKFKLLQDHCYKVCMHYAGPHESFLEDMSRVSIGTFESSFLCKNTLYVSLCRKRQSFGIFLGHEDTSQLWLLALISESSPCSKEHVICGFVPEIYEFWGIFLGIEDKSQYRGFSVWPLESSPRSKEHVIRGYNTGDLWAFRHL